MWTKRKIGGNAEKGREMRDDLVTKRQNPRERGRPVTHYKQNEEKKKEKPAIIEKKKEERLVISLNNELEEKVAMLLETIQEQKKKDQMKISTNRNGGSGNWNYLAQSSPDYQEKKTKYDAAVDGMARQAYLDHKYADELIAKKRDRRYQQMLQIRQRLPVYKRRQEIIDIVAKNQAVIICGETGCGKTTQVPQLILDSYIEAGKGSVCHIICTQPRRISAISVAERVMQERTEQQFNSVGYQVRLEKKVPRTCASILFCTTGIVLKLLESNQYLSGISHIIIDEVHERERLCDFLLIVLKELLTKRPDLKLILMSTSTNAKKFSTYFGNVPTLTISGQMFPVKEIFLEDIVEETKYSPNATEFLKNFGEDTVDLDLAVVLIRHICVTKPGGAILVFLPGWDHISKLHKLLTAEEYFCTGKLIFTVHSMMPIENQKIIFLKPPPGVRKIILATNIAETSITIDDVVYVIDSGKVKVENFDEELNLPTLKSLWVSKANALQRKGRAGRVQPGVCYRLYDSFRHRSFDNHEVPDILRNRLEEICLQIKILKLGKIQPVLERALDVPNADTVKLSIEFLQTVNALDVDENLTPLGFHLGHLPVDPQTGKMILFGSIFSCLDPVSSVAATLGFKDAFVFPIGKEKESRKCRQRLADNSASDHIMLANVLQGWEDASVVQKEEYCVENNLSSQMLKMLTNMKEQFLKFLQDVNFVKGSSIKASSLNQNSKNIKLVKAVLCAGLYPNVAKMTPPVKWNRQGVVAYTKHDKLVVVHPKSVNAHAKNFPNPWLVYHQKLKSEETVYLHDCTMIPSCPLLLFGGNLKFKEEEEHAAIVVDDWIRFWCSKRMAKLLMDLRQELDCLLERKITNLGSTNLNKESNESALLEAIVELLESEEILTYKLIECSKQSEKGDEKFEEHAKLFEEEAEKFDEEAEEFEKEAAQFEEEAAQFEDEAAAQFENVAAAQFEDEAAQFENEAAEFEEEVGLFEDNAAQFEAEAAQFEEEAEQMEVEDEAGQFEREARLFEEEAALFNDEAGQIEEVADQFDEVTGGSQGEVYVLQNEEWVLKASSQVTTNKKQEDEASAEARMFKEKARRFVEEATRLEEEAARFEAEARRFGGEIFKHQGGRT